LPFGWDCREVGGVLGVEEPLLGGDVVWVYDDRADELDREGLIRFLGDGVVVEPDEGVRAGRDGIEDCLLV